MRQAILISGQAMTVALERMTVISNNLANLSTTGYKKDISYGTSFQDQVARSIGTAQAPEVPNNNTIVVDYSAGNFRFTGDKMNVGIDGEGFIKVQLADGKYGYTRRGEFSINANKQLTIGGRIVEGAGGPITVDDAMITIDSTGAIYNQKAENIGTLKVVDFDKPYKLDKMGGTLFTTQPGAEEKPSTAEVKQQYLEDSNVSSLGAMVEMINLMDVMRQYETQQKLVQYQDESTGKMLTQIPQQ